MQESVRNPNVVRVIRCDETLIVAETGPLCVTVWRGSATAKPFEWQRVGLSEVVGRHPRGAAFLCVVETTSKPPEDDLRNASAKMIVNLGDRLKGTAVVIEGEGFMAAINRGVLTGMVLLTQRSRKSPIAVFGTVTDGARWLGQHIALPPLDELVSTIEHIRSRLPRLP
jgi:hypothetical protein